MTDGEFDRQTRGAVERTRLAHDRTLLAWIRTAASLISFGFSIYKAFDYLADQQGRTGEGLIGPRHFAQIMIAIGVVSLAVATIDHHANMRRLRQEYGALVPRSLTTLVAGLIATLGVIGFLAAVFQL